MAREDTPAELAALYPDHDAYVAAVQESADRAVEEGFLLPEERDAMVERAEEADVP